MNASNKSFGKSTLAGLFAVAALASAVPAFASTTTVTWDFFGGTYANQDIGPSATFTGTETPGGSLAAPLSGDLGITAYGYLVNAKTTTTTTNYYDDGGHSKPTSQTTGPTTSATDLYSKNGGGSENGLGLNGYTDSEIGDYSSKTSSTTNTKDKEGKDKTETVVTTDTTGTGVVQLDISNLLRLLGYAVNSDATVTIGSLQGPDAAVISASTSLGEIGTQLTTVNSNTGGINTTTLSAKQLSGYEYLNVSVAKPGDTVLLSTISLQIPANSGNPTPAAPAPVPASAGLTLAGALGMGMMLLARRRRSML